LNDSALGTHHLLDGPPQLSYFITDPRFNLCPPLRVDLFEIPRDTNKGVPDSVLWEVRRRRCAASAVAHNHEKLDGIFRLVAFHSRVEECLFHDELDVILWNL